MRSSVFLLSIMTASITAFSQSKNDKDDVAARFKELIAFENRGDSLAVRKMT